MSYDLLAYHLRLDDLRLAYVLRLVCVCNIRRARLTRSGPLPRARWRARPTALRCCRRRPRCLSSRPSRRSWPSTATSSPRASRRSRRWDGDACMMLVCQWMLQYSNR
eukprot:232484-Chlamydomonas_euryale.AAC.5